MKIQVQLKQKRQIINEGVMELKNISFAAAQYLIIENTLKKHRSLKLTGHSLMGIATFKSNTTSFSLKMKQV